MKLYRNLHSYFVFLTWSGDMTGDDLAYICI